MTLLASSSGSFHSTVSPACSGELFTTIAKIIVQSPKRIGGVINADLHPKYVIDSPAMGYTITPPRNANASKNPMKRPHLFLGIHRNNILHPGDQPIARDTAFRPQKNANAVMELERLKQKLATVAPIAPINIRCLGLYRSPKNPAANCPNPNPREKIVNSRPNS